jgi:hypothetical protein
VPGPGGGPVVTGRQIHLPSYSHCQFVGGVTPFIEAAGNPYFG